jgi:hypothetical protein
MNKPISFLSIHPTPHPQAGEMSEDFDQAIIRVSDITRVERRNEQDERGHIVHIHMRDGSMYRLYALSYTQSDIYQFVLNVLTRVEEALEECDGILMSSLF